MGKIYCEVGKSSTGKDTLLNLLVERGFIRVTSHTSRPRRSNEIDHKDYHFTSKEKILQMINNNEFIEVRSYNVANNDTWYYGIHKNEIDLNSNNNYICIVDGDGFKTLREFYGKDNVIGIYLWVNNRERLLRALNRCELDDTAVDEIVRRYQDDNVKFTKEVINNCILRINNIEINQTLDIVMRNIRNGM